MSYDNPCLEVPILWECYIGDNLCVACCPYTDSPTDAGDYRPNWYGIAVGPGFSSPTSPVLSWLCITLGHGVLVEGPGYEELLPTDYTWVFYDRGFYSDWPCFTIKFRDQWQKTAFMLQWGHLPITELDPKWGTN